jgi:hypothetical protein
LKGCLYPYSYRRTHTIHTLEHGGHAPGGGRGDLGGSKGTGSFPKGDVRSFFSPKPATASSSSSSSSAGSASITLPPPAKRQRQQQREPEVVLVVDDDDPDEEVEVLLPGRASSSSSSSSPNSSSGGGSNGGSGRGGATSKLSFPSPAPAPASAAALTDLVVWGCGTCTYANRRPCPTSSAALLVCEVCQAPAPQALQQQRSLNGKASASSFSSSIATAAVGGPPPQTLPKTQTGRGQSPFSSSDAAGLTFRCAMGDKDKEEAGERFVHWSKHRGASNTVSHPVSLHNSVSANTGRITVEFGGGASQRGASTPAARCNVSTDEFKEFMATKDAAAAATTSLANTPFEAVASALLLLPHGGPADGNDNANNGSANAQGPSGASLCAALLAEVGRFVDQWEGLRGWERKALADGRALRLPLAAHLQALEDERKTTKQGPCFERYLPAGPPPRSAASASGCASQPPAYVPGQQPKTQPQQAARALPAAPALPASSAARAAAASQPQQLECAWCRSQITDPEILRLIVIQQVRASTGQGRAGVRGCM